jgi:tetratricopeptide (TPR) repeat protein
MQRYRINYRLLIGLAIGGLVFAGLFFFIWSWQIDRNAERYIARANEAVEAGDLRTAFHNVHQFIRLRPKNLDARVRLANLAVDITKLDDATREEHGLAYNAAEVAVREVPGDLQLRRMYIEMLSRYGRPHDAITHILDVLANPSHDPEIDGELNALLVQNRFAAKDYSTGLRDAYKLVGYDENTDEFLPPEELPSCKPSVYNLLAKVLRAREKKEDLADRVMERMIQLHPDSFMAHLLRAKQLSGDGKVEQSREEMQKAIALDPTDADVLLQAGLFAMEDKDFDLAHKMFSEGLERYPEHLLFYDRLARVEAFQNNIESSLEIINRGIRRFPGPESIDLRLQKINILITKKDDAAFDETLQEIADLKVHAFNVIVDFERARKKVQQKRWHEATIELKGIIPRLFQFPKLQRFAGTLLAGCHEQLGNFDLALAAYRDVLESDPKLTAAQQGVSRLQLKLRLGGRAESNPLNSIIIKELAKPESLQRWDRIGETVDQMAEKVGISAAKSKLLHAQVFVQRKMFPEARELVKEAFSLDPEDLTVRLAAIKLLKLEPETGPQLAMELLDRVVEKFGDSSTLRVLRADLLAAIGADDLPDQLISLTEGIEGWSSQDQATLWSNLGIRFQQLHMREEAIRCWARATELVPSNLPTRMYVFDLALQDKDDAAMRKAQEDILSIVKDKEDSNYLFTEVKRRMIAYSQNKVSREVLVEARDMLHRALEQRPNWSELYVVEGQLAILLEQDKNYALKMLEEALKHGAPNLNAVSLQVRLLAEKGRYDEAREKMGLIPEERRSYLLGQVEATVLANTGDEEIAIESAEILATQQADKAETQLWFAQLAQKAGAFEKAEQAFQKLVKLKSGDPQIWMQLVNLYREMKQPEKVEQTLREAQLQLDAEYLPLLAGKYYELLGRWREAEDIYLAAYADRMDNVTISRRMAEFYLIWSSQNASNREKAAPFINRILRAVHEGIIESDHPDATWARRQTARILASSGDYQLSQQALQILSDSSASDSDRNTDAILAAQILATRKDPISVLKAIEQLEKIKKEHGLPLRTSLELAAILDRAGEWKKCESHLIDLIGKHGSNSSVWSAYISLLIDHDELNLAEQRLVRLEELVGKIPMTLQLRARLAAAGGDRAQTRAILQSMIPANLRLVDDKQLVDIRNIAQFAAELDEQQIAQQLFELVVKRQPEMIMLLVQYLAKHGDPANAVHLMKQLFPTRKDSIVQLAVQMLQQRREEFGDQYDEEIAQFVSEAIREDPESVHRKLFQAQLFEVLEQYPESIQAYEQILAHDDTPKKIRATTMNNISFLWALRGERLDEAAAYILEAEAILGPIADILDTKAVIAIAREQYDDAVRIMALSLTVKPTAAKWFHMAHAKLMAGDSAGAIQAWDNAMELDLSMEKLSKLEEKSYQRTAKQIADMKSKSAEL